MKIHTPAGELTPPINPFVDECEQGSLKRSAEIAELNNINNPCRHLGFESNTCELCGYPDPRKMITALKKQVADLTAEKSEMERRRMCDRLLTQFTIDTYKRKSNMLEQRAAGLEVELMAALEEIKQFRLHYNIALAELNRCREGIKIVIEDRIEICDENYPVRIQSETEG